MSPDTVVSQTTELTPEDGQPFLIWPHTSTGYGPVPASHEVSLVMVQLSDLLAQRP